MRARRAIKYRNPVLATLAAGILLGIALRAATPVTPLPPPEPAWRKARPAVAAQDEPYRWYSAETYSPGARGLPAWMAGMRSDGEPLRYAVGYVPHPPLPPLPAMRYDEAPILDPPPAPEQPPEVSPEPEPIVLTAGNLAEAAAAE